MIVSGFIVGALSMGAISSLNATTQEEHPLIDQYFALLDTNANKTISLNEYLATVKPTMGREQTYRHITGGYLFNIPTHNFTKKGAFEKISTEDGTYDLVSTKSITEKSCNVTELATAQQSLLFNSLDKNFNGELSKAELENSPTIPSASALKTEFQDFDQNSDTVISYEEFSNAFKAVREDDFFQIHQILYTYPYPATCWHPDAEGEATVKLVKHSRMLTLLDTDKQITYMFNQVDTNGDRSIDYGEYLGYFIPSP